MLLRKLFNTLITSGIDIGLIEVSGNKVFLALMFLTFMICMIKNYFKNGLWKVSPNIQYLLEILSSFSNKMYKLLFTLFIIKLYARINIFNYFLEFHKDKLAGARRAKGSYPSPECRIMY